MVGMLLALTLWCQFFTEEIRRDASFLHLRLEERGPREDPVLEGRTLDQWEEVLCSGAFQPKVPPPVFGVRLLGDLQQRSQHLVGRSGSAGH